MITSSPESCSASNPQNVSVARKSRRLGTASYKKMSCGKAGRLWKELEAKAKTRVEKWTEQHDELKKASAAKEELEKALDVFTSVYRGLKSANDNSRVLSSTVHKRKRDEALEQMAKASQTMKRMK